MCTFNGFSYRACSYTTIRCRKGVSLHGSFAHTSSACYRFARVAVSRCQTVALFLAISLTSSAQTIQGIVLNGTTGEPESRDKITLFTPSGERGSTTTDEDGKFQIEPRGHLGPRSLTILGVIHGGVEYFRSITSEQVVHLKVYDSSSQVSGISGYLSILQFQVKGKMLEVTELYALDNASSPPITRVGPDNLILSFPEGAQVQPATISGPDGGMMKAALVPIPGHGGEYSIDFPMKPGRTNYAINYQVPYDGELVFRRRVQYSTRRIGIIVPDSMRFQSLSSKVFRPTLSQPGTHELMLDGINALEPFAFKLSGTGALSRYFRPLNPGEAARTARPAMLTTPSPHGGSAPTHGGPTRGHPMFLGYRMILATGTLILAGILLWRMMLRRASRV
jgi:hypothetical protein